MKRKRDIYSTRSDEYIYSDNEKIPFSKRDSKFQLILRKEFASTIKEYYKS